MNNPKWQVGPVKLVNGYDGNILLFCEHRKVYLGTYRVPGGGVHCIEWRKDGTPCYGQNDLNLAPPPKKTVRVQTWILVNTNGAWWSFCDRESAIRQAGKNRFGLFYLDREVEENEGLS